MRIFALCAIFVLFMVSTAHVQAEDPSKVSQDDLPFEFVISLDEPPRTRWNTPMQTLLKKLGWEYSYKPVMNYVRSMIPNGTETLRELDPYFVSLAKEFGEYGEEMFGIYEVINATYPGKMLFGELVLMNIFYDVTAGCTSIVASSTYPEYCVSDDPLRFPYGALPSPKAEKGCASASNPRVIHGRNLDFPIPNLANITSVVHIKRGGPVELSQGEVLFRGVTYLGYVGILTGYRPAGWSVSVDQRNAHAWNNSTNLPIVDSIISFLKGGQSLGTFLRTSLTTIETYKDAVDSLRTTRLVAPVYLIVGGLNENEGAIITRDREGVDVSGGEDRGFWSINRQGAKDGWYRAQTNDDNWLPARDDRREAAHRGMDRVGSTLMNETSMARVMRTSPVLNEYTTFTTVMSPVFDELKTSVVHRYRTYTNPALYEQEHFLARYQPNLV